MNDRQAHMRIKDRFIYHLLILLVVVLIFGQRVVVPAGEFQIPVIVFILYLSLFCLLLADQVRVNVPVFMLYSAFFAVAVAMVMVDVHGSFFSFAYFIVLYFPFVFCLRKNNNSECFRQVAVVFQALVAVTAVIGIGQLFWQLAGFSFFDPFRVFPDGFVQQGYNTSYPIFGGASIFKPNGIFFLEPSFFSKYLAVALVMEWLWFKRWYFILLFSAALLTSLSGTGLLLALLFGVPAMLRFGMRRRFLLLVLLVPFIGWFLTTNYGNVILERVGEYQSVHSSAYIRFIAPFRALSLKGDAAVFWHGLGPGAVDRMSLPFTANFSVIPKLVLEYGVLTSLLFLMMMVWLVFRNRQSFILSSALLFMYLLLGGNLLQAQTVYFIYVLIVMIPRKNTSHLSEVSLSAGDFHKMSWERRLVNGHFS